MLTQGIQVQRYIRASAGRAALNVVFEDTNQPRHDGKIIYLPKITHKTTDMELVQLMASVDHEVAHDRYSDFTLLHDLKLVRGDITLFIWNFLEDSRVNAIEAREYRGFRENWDESTSLLIKDIIDKTTALGRDSELLSKIVKALMCWEGAIMSSTFPLVESVTSRYTPNKEIHDVLLTFTDRFIRTHYILDKKLGSKATYDLAIDILKALGKTEEVKKPIKEKEQQASKEGETKGEIKGETKGETKKESKDGEGKTTDEKEEKTLSSSEKDSKPFDDKDKGDEVDEDEYKIIKVKLTEEDLGKFSLTMPPEGKEMGKVGINFDPVCSTTGTWDLTDYSKFIVVDYPKSISPVPQYLDPSDVSHLWKAEYNRRMRDSFVKEENFAQQVRKLIQIRAKVQTQYGVKKGKLDQSRLSRICFDAPGGFGERVFKNKIENKTLDAAITVLVDMSGSMSGTKAIFAIASAMLINEVCSTINIPLEILGFTDGCSPRGTEVVPVMFIYKGFSDLKISNDNILTSFAKSSRYMAGNPDGENILWAYDRMLVRKEKKKILIVMSDGAPAASKPSHGIGEFTKQTIQEIEKLGRVSIYGLGLCSDAVKYYYKAHDVVEKADQIPSKLLTLIERKIINHG